MIETIQSQHGNECLCAVSQKLQMVTTWAVHTLVGPRLQISRLSAFNIRIMHHDTIHHSICLSATLVHIAVVNVFVNVVSTFRIGPTSCFSITDYTLQPRSLTKTYVLYASFLLNLKSQQQNNTACVLGVSTSATGLEAARHLPEPITQCESCSPLGPNVVFPVSLIRTTHILTQANAAAARPRLSAPRIGDSTERAIQDTSVHTLLYCFLTIITFCSLK
jgi:hypothetical protein